MTKFLSYHIVPFYLSRIFMQALKANNAYDGYPYQYHLTHSQGLSVNHELLLIPTYIPPTYWTILVGTKETDYHTLIYRNSDSTKIETTTLEQQLHAFDLTNTG